MSARSLPVRPDLDQLKRQAKELLRAFRAGDSEAAAEFAQFHTRTLDPAAAKLADAQLVLARSYGAPGWPRMVQCCQLIDAIWRDDLAAVRTVVTAHPNLIHEDALVRPEGESSSWGPPMSYAANLGRDRIIEMLASLGATDFREAIGRATLQSQIGTAKKLHAMMGSPPPPDGALGSPAYTLSESGTAFLFAIGARAVDEEGRRLAPVDVVLETDSRKPAAKRAILAMYEQHGLIYPDTPPMAAHRGRIDLLEKHLAADPGMLNRTFSHAEMYPPELGCHDEVLATHGTPLDGATLLMLCCDYDDYDIAQWLIAKGADVNARAAIDADGFGGHTALFASVVAQPHFRPNHYGQPAETRFTQLLLDHGADPNIRASLRKQLHPGYDLGDTRHEYRDVTALSWGRRFHFRKLVSEPALALIEAAGGVD